MNSCRTLWLVVVLSTTAGCGPGKAVVDGRVTYRSNPLTAGEVHLVGEGGASRSALIGLDGTFCVEDPPLGPVKVAVVSVAKGEALSGPTVERKGFGFRKPSSTIPPKYADVETSGLTYTVTGGRQAMQIDLKD